MVAVARVEERVVEVKEVVRSSRPRHPSYRASAIQPSESLFFLKNKPQQLFIALVNLERVVIPNFQGGMAAMEAALGWATVTVSEVSGSGGEGGGEGGGGKGGGEVIAPLSWGLGYNVNGGERQQQHLRKPQ